MLKLKKIYFPETLHIQIFGKKNSLGASSGESKSEYQGYEI